ncbi:hypothetical protein [Streptomyces sp. NPDC021356]|uniref:hypothetical protein n=1 Tax=Streptomyces sp. NPDC021356 TaxID=3154900 RepID=UPI0033CC3F54
MRTSRAVPRHVRAARTQAQASALARHRERLREAYLSCVDRSPEAVRAAMAAL